MPRMSRWGVGPLFAVCTLICAAPVAWLHQRYPTACSLDFIPRPVLLTGGVLLVAAGLALWIAGVLSVQRAYNSDKLCTSGACGLCRHPTYASWAVLVTPGVGLLQSCWAFFALAFVMYVMLLVLVRKEEDYLAQRFGEEYLEYQKRIPFAAPIGWLKTKRRE